MIKKTAFSFLWPLILAVAPWSLQADVAIFSAAKDNTLYQATDPNSQLSNGKGIYLFSGLTRLNQVRRGAIQFNLSSIPSNATITDATLTLFLSQSSPNPAPETIELHKFLRDWGEGASSAPLPGGQGTTAQPGDATWLYNFFNSSTWSTPG